MLNGHLEAWRYPGDCGLRELLLSEEPIRRAVESSKFVRERNSMRTRLLASAVAVDARVLPHLAGAVQRLNTQFPQVGQVECFVYNSSDVNAFIASGRTRTLVALSSAAVNHLDASELQFVLGHEFAHAFFGHLDMAANHLMESEDLLPLSAMRLRAWQRAAEISADRVGLMLSGSLDAALRAIFKASSGIFTDSVCTSPEVLADQWQSLLCELVEEGDRDFSQLSHPFPPLRMQAMVTFWKACQDASTERAISEANVAVARMLAMMDPAPIVRTSDDLMLSSFLFWGGMYVALADRELHPNTLRRLESVIPPGVALDDAHRQACEQPSACLTRFTQAAQTRRQKLSAVELHRIICGLIDIASADGRVSTEELARMEELAGALGISPEACGVIVDQYRKEGVS